MKKLMILLILVFVASACFAQKTTIDSMAVKLVALIESKNPYLKQYSNLEKTDSIWGFPINEYITTAKHYFGGISKKKVPVLFFQSYTDDSVKYGSTEKRVYADGCWDFYASIYVNHKFPSCAIRFDENNNVLILKMWFKFDPNVTFFYQVKGKRIYVWKCGEEYFWKKGVKSGNGKLISLEEFQKEIVSFQRLF
jgi:hypothetical protein